MNQALILLILLSTFGISHAQDKGEFRINANLVTCKGKIKEKIDSLELIIVDLSTQDTIHSGTFNMEFKRSIPSGYYMIEAVYNNYPMVKEDFIIRIKHVTFITLKIKRRAKCGKRNRLHKIDVILE